MNTRQINRAMRNVTCEVITIDRTFANKLLAGNIGNRKVNARTVALYASEMKAGNWSCNGDTITITSKGELLNGQHRLRAVVEANAVIVVILITGVLAKDFITMDQGRKRTNGTILDMSGVKHGTVVAATVKSLESYRNGFDMRDCYRGMAFSSNMMFEALETMKGVEESVLYAKSFKRALFTSTVIASLHNIFTGIDKGAGEYFMTAILTGDCGDNKELLKVRNFFLDIKMNPKSITLHRSRPYTCGIIIKAWNAWRNGYSLSDMDYKKGDVFPKAV